MDDTHGWVLEQASTRLNEMWRLTNETGADADHVWIGLGNDEAFRQEKLFEDLDSVVFACRSSGGQRLRVGWASQGAGRRVAYLPFP